MNSFPCWLSKDELEQARSLLDLGFVYCGNADDYCLCERPCGKVGKWQFRAADGDVTLDAICNGALYSWCLEIDPNFDEPGFFEARLKEAKSALKKIIKEQCDRPQIARQLSIFECITD